MSDRPTDVSALARGGGAEESNRSSRPLRLKLVVIFGPDVGSELPLAREPAEIGTWPGCSLQLHDPTVSRRHLEVSLVEDGVRLRDLGSRNGSVYQGGRFSEIVVSVGSVVRIGRSELRVVPDGAHDALPPSARDRFGDLIGSSLPMRQLYAVLERVAATDVPVLIEGETGTGKELTAEALHAASRRANGKFVVCDLGGVSRPLIEAELFGHVRGAFAGADRDREGAFALAEGGTIFIDELGELDLEVQPRLLRALERHQIKPVGGSTWNEVNVRVIASTNRDLAEEVRAGRFREDLYHRLAVVRVRLPPLRERKEDIPGLVQYLMTRAAESRALLLLNQLPGSAGAGPTTLDAPLTSVMVPPETMALLINHDWPGNVRELKNVLDRGLSLLQPPPVAGERPSSTERPVLTPGLLGLGSGAPGGGSAGALTNFHEAKEQLVSAWERDFVLSLLKRAGGNVSRAAREAGMDRVYLHRLMKKHGLGGISQEIPGSGGS